LQLSQLDVLNAGSGWELRSDGEFDLQTNLLRKVQPRGNCLCTNSWNCMWYYHDRETQDQLVK